MGDPLMAFMADVHQEISKSREKNGPFNSLHEAYAVMLEELDELWEQVKRKPLERDRSAIYRELVQIAAMASCTALEQVMR
jgi:hypothetical protein